MSNILRNKHGNLSKVKYFIPAYRTSHESSLVKQSSKPNCQVKTINSHRQQTNTNLKISSIQQSKDISFQIIGIHENNTSVQKQNTIEKRAASNKLKAKIVNKNDKKAVFRDRQAQSSLSSVRNIVNSKQLTMPEGKQKQQFNRFVQKLKEDQTYQQTVTMFTIMYFYEQKNKQLR